MRDFPEKVKSAFLKKGVNTEEAFMLVSTDMAREEVYCDAYTVFSREGIASLFCLKALRKQAGASSRFSDMAEEVLEELDYVYFPMEEIEKMTVEEQVSVLRVVIRKKSGEEEILFWATGACRRSVYKLSEAFDAFCKTGEVPEKDFPKMECCPRCGLPFSDPQRRICKKCFGKRSLLKKLLPFFLRYRWQMALVFLTVLLSGALSIFTPYLNNKVLYDEVLTEGSPLYGHVLFLVLSIAAFSLLGAFIRMINTIVGAKVAAFVSFDLKKTIFSSFERLSYSFFTSRHTGRLITQINSDAETLYWFFCDGFPYFLTNVLQICGIIVVMMMTNPLLSLVILVPLPVVFFGYVFVLRLFRRLHAEHHTNRSRFNAVLSDVLNGMRIVKAFSREEAEIERFHSRSSTMSQTKLKIDVHNHTVFPALNLCIRMTNYLVWGFGAFLVLKEGISEGSGITYGELNMFIGYLSMLYNPLNFFAHFFSNFANSLNALQRLFEIMEAEPEVKEKENALTPETVRGEVVFENVNFSYAPGKRTIQNVSFRVEAGQTLGIVGHTGAGKSTLANLLTRLYDVESGRILIDGVDIRDLSFETLRKNIAIVSQETYLFRGTIMDNIRYADPEADRDAVIAASKAAGCHDFIMSFPDGYETLVGFDKKSLSGGEKQRISIARAILRSPAILILDEATAAMDTKTERRIQTALEAITKNRTTITIAHRLSTLKDADFLIVVEEGRVVENGTHEGLLEKEDGVYRKLYQMQMEALKTIGIEE
ncbi:MAG: ABC transporter ATP-binding protein [Clostridia bacterium]|nr:ABC transporter ATP-binding protein [Clostridia bacterium]